MSMAGVERESSLSLFCLRFSQNGSLVTHFLFTGTTPLFFEIQGRIIKTPVVFSFREKEGFIHLERAEKE